MSSPNPKVSPICTSSGLCGTLLLSTSLFNAFAVCIHTENQNQVSFYPFVRHEISVLIELTLGHLRYRLTDVPPQPNSPPDNVLNSDRRTLLYALAPEGGPRGPLPPHSISKKTIRVVVFQVCRSSHLCYTSNVFSQSRTRVKLNHLLIASGACCVATRQLPTLLIASR